MGKGSDKSNVEDEENSTAFGDDDDKSRISKKPSEHFQLSNANGAFYCPACDIWKDQTTCHCDECDVCIEQFDHHCIFFGKCIGGGNIIPFWGSLGTIIVVFCYFGFLTVMDVMFGK